MCDHAVEDQHYQRKLDPSGHCIDHPQIRVRRPNANGIGWRTILTNGCPLCAVDPIKPLARKGSNGSNAHALTRRDSNGSTRRRNIYPLDHEFATSYCSSCDITETTVASSNSSSSCHSNLDDSAFQSPLSPTSSRSNTRIACGMRYVDPTSGRAGTYTGQVSPDTQLPNGIGCLKLHDGDIWDGECSKGRLIGRDDTQQSPKEQQNNIARHPSRGRRDYLSESLSRSCRLENEDHNHLARHSSRSHRATVPRRSDDDEHRINIARHPSRSKRESYSRSCSRSRRFDEDDEDANSIGDLNSIGSHGEHTVGAYSAREYKSSLPPKRSSGATDRRPNRSYMEVKR